MAKANGKPTRLSREELATLTRARAVRDDDERLAAVNRATTGLRVGVRVTPSLYRALDATRGTLRAARGVFAIEDATLLLPDVVALDTRFVVEARIESQPLHDACARFAQQIVTAGPAVVTSELLEIELTEAAFAIALKQRWAGAGAATAPTAARGGPPSDS